MYLSFYGLNEKPFNLTPDASFLYPSQIHREVLGHLLFGIENRRGFILVTGEVGAGKTTLCRVLLNQIDEKTEVAFVLNSFLTEFELLKTINEDLGIATTGKTRKELIDELNKHLLESRAKGNNIVVIIDEAQNLSIPVLEQLRMLSNLETEKEKLLQIILVGQPELNKLLENEKIRQLNQRITVRHHITPLTKAELKEYIYYRLNVAGGKGDIIFNDGALDVIFRYTKGIPRAINIICDQALLIGYVANSRRITHAMASRAVKEVWGSRKNEIVGQAQYRAKTITSRAAVGVTIIALFISAGLLFLNHIKGTQTSIIIEKNLPHKSNREQIIPVEEHAITKRETPGKQNLKTATAENIEEGQGPSQSETPEYDFKSSSLIMLALDSGGGRMLGKELNSLTGPLTFTDNTGSDTGSETSPPAQLAEISSWATDIDATVDLLRLWKVEQQYVHTVQRRFKDKNVEPAKVAGIVGMGYAVLNTNIEKLRMLNLPAIAEIRTGKKSPGYIVISGLSVQTATILVSSRKMEVDIKELTPLLTGGMVIYCGDSFVNPEILHSGMEMSIRVRKLQDYMKELGYFDGNCSGWFTSDTQNAVLKFQVDNDLKYTGQVTGYMKLLIYTGLPHEKNEVPWLTE